MTQLARRLNAFDATMIVIGGIIGSGIFINPYVVARQVHTPALILGVWIAGGAIALLGAFVYAELASLRPEAGGQYAYLRDAFHPLVAFLYGWALLLVVQSGGMAAVAVTFARYAGATVIPEWALAIVTLLVLTIINCLGVRSGSNTQTILMLLKLAAIAILIVSGGQAPSPVHASGRPGAAAPTLLALAAAMTPVMFAYGGWQTSSFISGELQNPKRDLVIGLLTGVAIVIAIYVSVNYICLRVLGVDGLAQTTAPAAEVMRRAMGDRGVTLISAGIAISTLGFLSQSMLTAPRVYYAMASDGLFFKQVAKVHPKTRVPVLAIILQGVVAAIIAASGTYEQILGYVVSVDFIFFGLTGAALLIFRRRGDAGSFRTPGHPVTTVIFITACWLIVAGTVAKSPVNSAIGFGLLLAGVPAYAMWRRRSS